MLFYGWVFFHIILKGFKKQSKSKSFDLILENHLVFTFLF